MNKFVHTTYDSFFKLLKENQSESQMVDREMLEAANLKVRKSIIWLNINKGFYANLLPYLNIYGSFSLEGKTMATDGKSIIFHPEFVMQQSDAAVRLVLCHEILHCVNEHHRRRGNRNPLIWNYATDFAINPILKDEEGLEWPKIDGKVIGLYEEKYDGMTAEDIYDELTSSYTTTQIISMGTPLDDVKQDGDKIPSPDGQVVQIGESDDEDDEQSGSGEEGEEQQDSEGKDKGKKDGKGKDGKESDSKREKTKPSVGQKVKLLNGQEATIKKVYDNGDIEI